jgi:carbon storage regulator
MLVMTRKVGERIVIGDNVTVTVVRIAGGLVRIGIEAPPEYIVVRRELTGDESVVSESSPASHDQ